MASSKTLAWVVIAVVVASAMGIVSLDQILPGAAVAAPTTGDYVETSTGLTTVKFTAVQPLNSTTWYDSPSLAIIDSTGNEIASETLTSGTSKSYSTGVSVINPTAGAKVRVMNSATLAATEKDIGYITGGQKLVDMSVPRTDSLTYRILDTAYTNRTVGTGGLAGSFAQDQSTSAAVALASAGSDTFVMRYKVNSGQTQFGNAITGGFYMCVDINTSVMSVDNGISVDRGDWVKQGSLPKYCSDNSYDIAYKLPIMKASMGEQDVKITVRADNGEPTTTSDVRILAVDEHFFRQVGGDIEFSSADNAATDLGETNTYIEQAYS